MRGALDVHRELLDGDVPHEVVRLPRTLAGADELPEVLGIDPARCVAVRCYVTTAGRGSRERTGTVAVLMRAGEVPDPAGLLDALGVDTARPATHDEVSAATDQAAGLLGPVGLPLDVERLADRALVGDPLEVLYATTGESGVALGIRTSDLLRAVGARVVSLAGPPASVRAPAATVLHLDRSDAARGA